MERIAMLNEILAQDPNNAFARYGLAMEYSNSGHLDQALEEFKKLFASNPDYAAGYFMAAQTLMKSDRRDEARTMLESGIIAALHPQHDLCIAQSLGGLGVRTLRCGM